MATMGSGNLLIFKNSSRKKVTRMRCFNDVECDMVVLYIVRVKLINICYDPTTWLIMFEQRGMKPAVTAGRSVCDKIF